MKPVTDGMILDLFGYRPGRGEQKKIQILEAVIEILAQEGIQELTFESVGKKVRLGKANVRYHFKTVHEMVEGAFKFITFVAQKLTLEKMERAGTPRAKIEAVVGGAFEWYRNFPMHIPVWGLFCYYSAIDSKLSRLHSVIRAEGRNRLAGILKEADYSDREANDLASEIQSLITGTLLDLAVSQNVKDVPSAQRVLVQTVRRLTRL